jgi:hypothetical protein
MFLAYSIVTLLWLVLAPLVSSQYAVRLLTMKQDVAS